MITSIQFIIGQLQFLPAYHWSFVLYDVIFFTLYGMLFPALPIGLYFLGRLYKYLGMVLDYLSDLLRLHLEAKREVTILVYYMTKKKILNS